MKKIVVLLSTFLLSCVALAQTKISLEDAVLQQSRKFAADRMNGFQWIPNTANYVYYTDSWTKMKSGNAKAKTESELITLADVNKALGTSLKHFFGTVWVNQTTIMVSDAGKYYHYDYTTKTGKKVQETPETAENQTFDGTNLMIAYTEANNLYFKDKSGNTIAVTSETNKGIVSGQSIARNEFGINGGIFWSPNSSYLAFYQKDESEVADYPLLDITETPGKLVPIKYPMIGQKSEKPRVGIYNLNTGKTVFIAPRNNKDDYLTNLSWTPDEKYILIAELNRGQNDMCLNLYDAQTGAFVRTLLNETNDRWVEPEHEAFFPTKMSSNFVWFSEKDGFQNLYYYDITGKLIKKLTDNRFPIREIIGTDPAGKEIYFKATGENGTNMLVYKVNLKGKQTLITKDMGVHNALLSPDGNWLFDEYSNHNTPSKSLIYDKSGKSTVVLESKNKYEGYTLGTADITTIKAADGVTDLYTRLIKPSNFDPNKKYPVMIYVYGGPHAQMITNSFLDGANLWMYWMAEQGYLVFTVDNRGSDNRGFDFESVIHANLGDNEIADQMKGVDYLKSLPYVDANRLAVHGWSYGGFMTTSLMLRQPDTFKVAVAGGPVIDWKWYEVMYGERYMDTPAENQAGFDKACVINYAKNLKGKLLLIHGTNDDVVVDQHNLSLVKKCVELGKQVDYFPYPMHKHNVTGKDRVHLITKILNYIIDNNK